MKLGRINSKLRHSTLRQFFWPRAASLTQRDITELERQTLISLARRSAFWILTLLALNGLVLLKGQAASDPLHGVSKQVWGLGLWTLTALYAALLPWCIRLNANANVDKREVRTLHMIIVAWATVVSFWWFAGNWSLVHNPTPGKGSFRFDDLFFLFMTLLGQVVNVLYLAPSVLASVSVIAIGFALPFFTLIARTLPNPDPDKPSIALIFLSHLTIYLIVAVFVGIVEQRRLRQGVLESKERKIADSERMIADAERVRANTFIGAISHDIRQPLTVLSLTLRTIERSPQGGVDPADVERLSRQAAAIEDMVDGALNLAKIDSGTWILEQRTVALPVLMERLERTLQEAAALRGVRLTFRPLNYIVKTDPIALRSILDNLIRNGIKYGGDIDKGRAAVVSVGCTLVDDTIKITVEDNGCGIPSSSLGQIFDPYFQLGNPERDRTKGLGLGLSIVRGLIDKLENHSITAESEVGVGSRFVVSLPSVCEIPNEEECNRGAWDDGVNQLNRHAEFDGLTVILIEDGAEQREAFRRFLINHGCYVIDGETAEKVLEKIDADGGVTEPVFLLSDWRLLNGTSGLDAVDEVRAALGNIPGAIWTAETDPVKLKEIALRGLDRLGKPPKDEDLHRVLSNYVKGGKKG